MAKVPLAHGISTSRSMNFELGFGVCLNRTKIIPGFLSKAANRAFKAVNEILYFQISLTLTLTLTLTLYTKNTVA